MADIQITCPSCGTLNIVSEFTDPDNILCRDCKLKLTKPANAGKPKHKPTVRRKAVHTTINTANSPDAQEGNNHPQRGRNPQTATQIKTQQRPARQTIQTTTKLQKEPKKFKISDTAWSCVVFIVLGAITGTLRYANVLTLNEIETFDSVSPFIYLVAHVLISLNIAKESVMGGFFAFLFPPYMLYYLFVVSDNFYCRAVVAGLAVGMGQATVLFWSGSISFCMDQANDWIHNPYNSN